VCVVGGAGFIGSHLADRLLDNPTTEEVRIFDNFSSGRRWHLERHRNDARMTVTEGDVRDSAGLTAAIEGVDTVIHLASNPDIARSMTDPAIDFDQGTALTHHILEAMRLCGAQRILYASGSGVYGDLGELVVDEDHGPLVPISTYGASKLAGEALIASYTFMFELTGLVFRFGNVVGSRQTHGIGFDFIRHLLADPSELHILGDGTQSKSYIDVSDVVEAVLIAARWVSGRYEVFNVATGDYVTVKEIAELATEIVGTGPSTRFSYTGGDRGWKGDVPVVRLDTRRIRSLGWTNRRSSAEALRASLTSMLQEAKEGRLD
jgi:UDP-glucose 4-epimerase